MYMYVRVISWLLCVYIFNMDICMTLYVYATPVNMHVRVHVHDCIYEQCRWSIFMGLVYQTFDLISSKR